VAHVIRTFRDCFVTAFLAMTKGSVERRRGERRLEG
jgi:hypothetical protein